MESDDFTEHLHHQIAECMWACHNILLCNISPQLNKSFCNACYGDESKNKSIVTPVNYECGLLCD